MYAVLGPAKRLRAAETTNMLLGIADLPLSKEEDSPLKQLARPDLTLDRQIL
jgi:hypothetical protein